MAPSDKESHHSKSPTPVSGVKSTASSSKSSKAAAKLPPHLKNKKSKQPAYVGKIAKTFGLLILPVSLGVILFYVQYNFFHLPSLVKTPSKLPRVLPGGYFTNVSEADEYFWGTYRSSCYFGLKTRSPTSPLVGLVWYTQPIVNVLMPSVRHWSSQTDDLKKYGWLEHDGKSFGVQEIIDEDLTITTSFVKRAGGKHGGDWTMRIEAETTNPAENDTTYSFIVYLAMDPTSDVGSLTPTIEGPTDRQFLTRIDGQHPDLGQFSLQFDEASNLLVKNFLAKDAVDTAFVKEAIITGTGFSQLSDDLPGFYLSLMGYLPKEAPPTKNPRFLALQITVVGSTKFDVVFESGSVKNRPNRLAGLVFDQELQIRRQEFNDRFEQIFNLKEKMQAEVYEQVGKHALSNMLGSMGHFQGSSKVRSAYTRDPWVPYGPLTLFSTVPSRSFFPRGFLWDEGFHQLLVFRWNKRFTREIIGSWLDLMNVEGWIPREIILGSEAEARVPAEFVVQRDTVANPPMFFYVARVLLDRREEDPQVIDDTLRSFYPRLKAWYKWLNSSQSGAIPGTFRWRGRNGTTEGEVNPKTLASGLDDYPRASHPTDQEYHIDLYAWMALGAKVLVQMARLFDDKTDLPAFEFTANLLNSESHMSMFHWSQKSGRFCDYGLHTRNVTLEQVEVPLVDAANPSVVKKYVNGQPVAVIVKRIVSTPPKLRLVSDTFGYVSLFPVFLRILPVDSPKLGVVLESLKDEDLLWTPYGLRSLAKKSLLYAKRNTEHDPPYWRGSIWFNMNYLALSSLYYYSSIEGPHRQLAFEIYASLRNNLITNVVKEYKRTGYLWEHYDDVTGQGVGSHPFTGWTSLVLLVMGEQYD